MTGLLLALIIVVILAVAFAFICNVVLPRARVAVRTSVAALLAGFLPVLPALFLVPAVGSTLTTVLPLLIGGIVLSAVIGFPVAYMITKRKQRPVDKSVFD